MIHLPMPEDAGDGVIKRQCAKPEWEPFRDRWLAAARAYRSSSGDPWAIQPAPFTKPERALLSGLYDTRRKSGVIARIRRPTLGYASCPVCGSSGGRSLDHALPRSEFPEFSIVRENLVPACTICNSDEKGREYRGSVPNERLLHPYYDDWASEAIWQVEFGQDLSALVLKAVPVPGMTTAKRATVAFHLEKVLGQEWLESARRYWGSLPLSIRSRLGPNVTSDETNEELRQRLIDETFAVGVNGWRPAFLRGAIVEARVSAEVARRARALPD